MRSLARSFMTIAILFGCSGEQLRAPGAQPALTAVHDATLRTRMARLERLMVDELPERMRGPEARREISLAAGELKAEALRLPDLANQLGLSGDEKSHFYVFADSLLESASRLAAEATTGTAESVVARYETIAETCVGCHNLFRALPE